ncbi:hypothetical protein ACOSQ3_020458 [Xanthoceras sorbifolium]
MDQRLRLSPELLKSHSLAEAGGNTTLKPIHKNHHNHHCHSWLLLQRNPNPSTVHNNIINFLPNRRCSSPSSPPPPLPPTSASFSNSPRLPAACFLAAPRRVSLVVLFAEENVKKNTIDGNGKYWKG